MEKTPDAIPLHSIREMRSTNCPVRAHVVVLRHHLIVDSREINAEQDEHIWLGPGKDMLVGETPQHFIKVYARMLAAVTLYPGMKGVMTFHDAPIMSIEKLVGPHREHPICVPLNGMKTLFLSYQDRDVHITFLRENEVLTECTTSLDDTQPGVYEGLPRPLFELSLPSPLAAIEEAGTRPSRRLRVTIDRVTIDNGVSREEVMLGVNEPFQAGPKTPVPVPELALKTDIVIQREGAPPVVRFEDREGWAFALNFTKNSDAYLELSQLQQIPGCVTPPINGAYEISLANAVEAALRIGDHIFYITYA